MGANNYIRIGHHPNLVLLTFNDKDREEVERIRLRVEELRGKQYEVPIALWKRCPGMLSYAIIGESSRGMA